MKKNNSATILLSVILTYVAPFVLAASTLYFSSMIIFEKGVEIERLAVLSLFSVLSFSLIAYVSNEGFSRVIAKLFLYTLILFLFGVVFICAAAAKKFLDDDNFIQYFWACVCIGGACSVLLYASTVVLKKMN